MKKLIIFLSFCSCLLIFSSCEVDGPEYYIKYSAGSIIGYPINASVRYTNENGKSIQMGTDRLFQSGKITIGPVYKGFNAKLSASSEKISIKIECSKDGGPFVEKAFKNNGGTINYKIK